MRLLGTILFLVTTLSAAGTAQDGAKKKLGKKEQEKKIIAELETALKQWETAFNAKDAVALAKLYDVNTDVIYDNDVHHRNRKSLQKQFEERFVKEANQKQTITEVERKILTRRIVIETGVWENAGSSDTTRAQRGRYSCTWMKKKGKWLIVHDRGWGVTKKK